MNAFVEYFRNIQEHNGDIGYIHSCPELMECIRQVGFLPLLESGIQGYAAESLMAEECRFTQFPDGTWELRAAVSMVSSLQARRASSVVSGGQTSIIGVAAITLCQRKAPSRISSLPPCVNTAV